jgi:multiple sugar transport system permease protein
MKPRVPTFSDQEAKLAFWLLFPTFIVVLAFVIIPVLSNLWLSIKPITLADLRDVSLFNLNLTLKNFQKVFGDPEFLPALQTTLIYTIAGSLLSILLGLMAALLVNTEFPGRGLIRGLFISPYIAPVVAVTFTWSFILDPQLGVLNWAAVNKGVFSQPIPFLSQRWWVLELMGVKVRIPLALISVICFEGWRYFPFAFLFILARLQAIPDVTSPYPKCSPFYPRFSSSGSSGRSISSTIFSCSRGDRPGQRS